MSVCICLKRKCNVTLCKRCGLECLSEQEHLFVKANLTSNDPVEYPLGYSGQVPEHVNINKVIKYLAHKLQIYLHKKRLPKKAKTMIEFYKRVVLQGYSFAHIILDLITTGAIQVLKLTLDVFSTFSESIRFNIVLSTIRYMNLEVYIILLIIDGLLIFGRYIWDLVKIAELDPSSNLFKAVVQRVNKTTLAERFYNANSMDQLRVLMSESSVLEAKLILFHLRKVKDEPLRRRMTDIKIL